MAIFRGTTSVAQAAKIDPKRGAAGSLAESYRGSILGAPSKFRSSTFDPDTASLAALKKRSGEISTAMTPAPRELEFSDTGNVRDVWSQSSDPPSYEYGEDRWGYEPPSAGSEGPPKSPNWTDEDFPGMGGMFPGSGGPGSGGMGGMGGAPPTSFMEPSWASGKDVTTGRILREHPDKFKSEGDPSEPGGRFFKRVPAILRRIDPMTARPTGATGEDYGKPGGYKFVPEYDYAEDRYGDPRSVSDPYFRGI